MLENFSLWVCEGSTQFMYAGSAAGDYRTQFHVKAEAIAAELSSGQYDFGFLHIKAVDDTGHDQQPVLKVPPHISCVYQDLDMCWSIMRPKCLQLNNVCLHEPCTAFTVSLMLTLYVP